MEEGGNVVPSIRATANVIPGDGEPLPIGEQEYFPSIGGDGCEGHRIPEKTSFVLETFKMITACEEMECTA